MEIIYCKKWWFPRKKPIEIFNEDGPMSRFSTS